PVAASHRKFSWNLLRPLRENMSILLGSKPLILAVLGIAFAAYMTLFVRQSLLYEGEIDKELQAVHALARKESAATVNVPSATDSRWWRKITTRLDSAAQQSELRVS